MQIHNNVPAFSSERQTRVTEEDIQDWFTSHLAKVLEVDASEIDINIPFDNYGLDSAAAVELTGDLENWLKLKLAPTLLYDYPTIESLSCHLVDLIKLSD